MQHPVNTILVLQQLFVNPWSIISGCTLGDGQFTHCIYYYFSIDLYFPVLDAFFHLHKSHMSLCYRNGRTNINPLFQFLPKHYY